MDIEGLADRAMEFHRSNRLKISAAVWTALREKGLANMHNSQEIAKSVLRELQKRSTAKRNRTNNYNRRVMADMFATASARGGDPD